MHVVNYSWWEYFVILIFKVLNEWFSYSLTFQWVRDEYRSGGWTRHHAHMLQYEKVSAEGPNPSVSFRISELADDEEKNWKVTLLSAIPVSCAHSVLLLLSHLHPFWLLPAFIISQFLWLCVVQFEKSVVDQLTEKHNFPFTRFGIEWRGSSFTPRFCTACRIQLLGMKVPYNYFTIFLPPKALEPDRNKEGTHVQCISLHVYYVCVCPVITSTLPYSLRCRGGWKSVPKTFFHVRNPITPWL